MVKIKQERKEERVSAYFLTYFPVRISEWHFLAVLLVNIVPVVHIIFLFP